MALHPEAQAVLDAAAQEDAGLGDPGELSPAELRAAFAESWQASPDPIPVGRVYQRTIPGPAGEIPVRVYQPEGEGPWPVLVWYHGGGWVIGSLDENDTTCRTLCRDAEVVLMSVDYRLAPEHPFPAAPEDAYAAVCWVAEHGAEISGDPGRIAVAGESAGGNLAAVVSLMSRDRGGPPIALQILASPVTAPPKDRPSYVDYADGYFITRSSMEWFFGLYPRTEADLRHPYLSPLYASDLSGLPPALVLVAEYEVLRDEGEEYAHRLRDAGVEVELVRYAGQIHGFFALLVEQLSVSAQSHQRAVDALRRAFRTVTVQKGQS